MTTQTSQEAEHAKEVLTDGETGERGTVPQVNQPAGGDHKRTQERPGLPEQVILRRLWRIYEMALAAASRTEQE